ncbi:hypothetical protein KXZ27_28535, partial [Klebsiella pneumoniae]|nr:hypothetical protein [Klebsiella pneumoniae]
MKAPTSFHMDGAVILTMPLVARYLPPVEQEPETIVVNLDEDYKAPVGNQTGTVAKLAMRQPFVLFKGLTFQKLCL